MFPSYVSKLTVSSYGIIHTCNFDQHSSAIDPSQSPFSSVLSEPVPGFVSPFGDPTSSGISTVELIVGVSVDNTPENSHTGISLDHSKRPF